MSLLPWMDWVLVLTLGSVPAQPGERTFASWDDFYREYVQSKAQEAATDLPPEWRNGEQVSRDFEIGEQTLRLFNPPARSLRLNGRSLRVAAEWPKPVRDAVDLAGASAFVYPGTRLLACVQANFQGLGQSGRFQNVRQLSLVFRAEKPQGKEHVIRVTGYGFDCRGVYQGEDGWRMTQAVEGEAAGEKQLKQWRLGDKALTPLEGAVTIRTDDGTLRVQDR